VLRTGNTIGGRKKDETTKKPFSKMPLTDLILNMFLGNGFSSAPGVLAQINTIAWPFLLNFSDETCHSTGTKGRLEGKPTMTTQWKNCSH
jgi:hypothetical protein